MLNPRTWSVSAQTADHCRSYLLGAMHDGTLHGSTVRISQKEESYVRMVRALIIRSGGHAWVYREGARRELFVVEFSRSFLGSFRPCTIGELASYARGYFDAEGGVPCDPAQGSYLYFAQKDCANLRELRDILQQLGIACGKMHRPSAHVAPRYWRFYVSRASHRRFEQVVGSWHPRKAPILRAMVDQNLGPEMPDSRSVEPFVGPPKGR